MVRDFPKAIVQIQKDFQELFSQMKNILFWVQMKSKNFQDQRQILGESKQNFCHKEKYMRGRVLLKKNLNCSPQVKIEIFFEKSK